MPDDLQPKHLPDGGCNQDIAETLDVISTVFKSKDTVARAFGDLQAKGFIKVTKGGSLGISGMGKCPEYEIAALTLPKNGTKANEYFKDWKEGNDFKVFKHPVKNGKGKNKSLS